MTDRQKESSDDKQSWVKGEVDSKTIVFEDGGVFLA